MKWYVEGKSKKVHLAVLLTLISACLTVNVLVSYRVEAQTTAGGTTIGATVCAETSQVTLTVPISDSVVTDPTVVLEGTVEQASQIEIKVDDVFDSIIPLNIGQNTFTGSVQLDAGTHTIKVTAVNSCAGINATATAVVTYTPPPHTPSTGEATSTTIGDSGVTSASGEQLQEVAQDDPGLIDIALRPIQDIAGWLNIDVGNDRDRELSRMPIGNAVVFTGGVLLAVVGVASPLLIHASTIPAFAALAQHPTRLRLFSRYSRIVGIIMILGALFL